MGRYPRRAVSGAGEPWPRGGGGGAAWQRHRGGGPGLLVEGLGGRPRGAGGDGPFLLYLPYYTVHVPLQAKKEKEEKYAAKAGDEAHNNAVMAGMIESLDENVGRLMDCLDEEGIAENTLVVFTSDNGGAWNASKQWPLRAGKGSYYEGGIRVPLIVRWPRCVKPGARSAEPVAGTDFLPTFLEAAGQPAPPDDEVDGVSLLPLLTGELEAFDRPIFFHFPIYLQKGNEETGDFKFRTRPGSVVRQGKWKLHEYFEDGRIELYNLEEDLGEKENLASSLPDKANELLGILRDWRESIGAPVPTELNPLFQSENG